MTNPSAEKFFPNFHTDPDYCRTFLDSDKIRFLAYKLSWKDPVTVDLENVKQIPVDFEHTKQNCINKGSYLLLLHNQDEKELIVGRLGVVNFKQGYYLYAGSAMNSLDLDIAIRVLYVYY